MKNGFGFRIRLVGWLSKAQADACASRGLVGWLPQAQADACASRWTLRNQHLSFNI